MNYELTKNETKCSFLKTTLIRSIWLPAHPPARPPAHLHTSPSACPSMCLPARPSACLPVYTRFYKQSERLHKCDVADCGKEYFHSWHLRRHKTNIHNKSSYKTYFKCSYPGCFMELSSEQNLKRHHYRAHKRKHPFVCEYCDKDFVKHNQLRTHIFQHTGVPPFRCEECTVGFTSARELKRHQRSHRNYKCDCGKNFRFWSLLQQHNKLFHPPEFTCDVCQKRFMSRCKLKVHVLIHQDPSNRDLLLCPYDNCERSYMYKRNLTEHMKRFHEKNLFECSHPDCGRKLSSKKKLEYHLKLHEAKRPPRRNTRPRNKRRDAGKPKRAASALLCGFTYEEEKALLAINSVTNDTTDIELCMLGVDQLSDKTTESPDTGITKNKESKKTNQEHSDMGMTEEFVVVITEDVQNVHLLLEYRPHIDVSLTCEHDPKLQEYCVCPQNMPQFDSEGIPNQAPETNKPMILNGPTSRNREGSDQVSMEAKQLGHLYLSIDQETFDPSTGEPYD
ncbi:P43 5S RNA-binding protein-like isoform X3 [Periplaneta americana]|uniref:P43 5S RNA-binding protein-like isoform X3 n=1 Tax=Periplaneta americana TaxID=6978 RepID=UPI0037E97BFF